MSKLNKEQIASIIELYTQGKSCAEIAPIASVCPQDVYYIVKKYNVSRSRGESIRNAINTGRLDYEKRSKGKSLIIANKLNVPCLGSWVVEHYNAGKSCNEISELIMDKTGLYMSFKGVAALVKKFGTIRSQSDSFRNSISTGRMKYKSKGVKLLRKGISSWMRYAVLERDGHKCTSCGNTDLLEIDHVKSVRDGGENTVDNLITLCKACNLGKFHFEEINRKSVLDRLD